MHPSRNVAFFFQAEDGIRDWSVTGVQTCALPILIAATVATIAVRVHSCATAVDLAHSRSPRPICVLRDDAGEIGRASCRERLERAERALAVTRSRYSKTQETQRSERQCDGEVRAG